MCKLLQLLYVSNFASEQKKKILKSHTDSVGTLINHFQMVPNTRYFNKYTKMIHFCSSKKLAESTLKFGRKARCTNLSIKQ